MTDFIVSITDAAQLAGITWAREKYNESLPPPPPPPDPEVLDAGAMREAPANGEANPMNEVAPGETQGEAEATPMAEPEATPMQAPLDTDDAYVQWVMEQAAASYAVQQEQETWIKAYQDAQQAAGRSSTGTPPAFPFPTR
jgi:hypothetical protein